MRILLQKQICINAYFEIELIDAYLHRRRSTLTEVYIFPINRQKKTARVNKQTQ